MPRLEPFLLEGESLDAELHSGSTSLGLTRTRLVLHRVGFGRDVRDLVLADVRSVRLAESPDWRLVWCAPLFLVAALLLPSLARQGLVAAAVARPLRFTDAGEQYLAATAIGCALVAVILLVVGLIRRRAWLSLAGVGALGIGAERRAWCVPVRVPAEGRSFALRLRQNVEALARDGAESTARLA